MTLHIAILVAVWFVSFKIEYEYCVLLYEWKRVASSR